jgi:Ca2+-binding RTX toxin-like protein
VVSSIAWINDGSAVHLAEGHAVSGFETLNVTCGAGDDLISNAAYLTSDTIIGGAGDDSLLGGGGADRLSGGDGNDLLVSSGLGIGGGAAPTELSGGEGHDSLRSGAGNDSLSGDAGNDTLRSGGGYDSVFGGIGTDRFVLDSRLGNDWLPDFTTGSDTLSIVQSGLPVGDGDAVVEGAVIKKSPGGHASSAELVVVTGNLPGHAITAEKAALAIGSASGAYASGQTAIFAVDNGSFSSLFYFQSSGNDAEVSADELSLLCNLGTASTAVADFAFEL